MGLYGKATKKIRHVDETDITLEPQRFFVHDFWRYASSAAARTDGDDLQDDAKCPLGSVITKHKVEILVTPETIEPQQLYMGRIKLSYNDIYSPAMCGVRFHQDSYQDITDDEAAVVSNAITPHLFPDDRDTGATIQVEGHGLTNQEIGGSGSGYGIKQWLLDDHIKHFVNLKKVTVFDQRPLMGERWQRIPSKVKRINEGTFYGIMFFNDSDRGATPADTQIKINIKSYYEEWAL